MDMKEMKEEQHVAINANFEVFSAAVKEYSAVFEKNALLDDLSAVGEISQCHVKMIESVKQMQSAVYGPLNMVMLHYEECLRSSSLRALLEMGVFDSLPVDGHGMSAATLAENLRVDEILLVRLMRVVVPTFFTELSPGVYTHTPNSLVYLIPSLRANFKMMYDEICVASVKIPEFLQRNGYRNPSSSTDNPYTYAHNTKGLGMFDFLLKDPVRLKNLNDAMQARSSQTLLPYHLFPFKEEFSKVETTVETVLLVDVGGGNGQAAAAIRELCAGIKGRVILQDQLQVIEGIIEPLPGVDLMASDFFKSQPIKGALIYYIHRCLHDWPDNECIIIMKHIAASMEPGRSRLLISEIVMPVGSTDIQTAWSDINMLVFGGIERSEKQWKALLDQSGFTILNVHGEAGKSNFRVLEVVLK